ncbi:hypothetical protein A3Q56_07547 [Intoshia linei]|uniref:Uncharacterized protein n=1 Tax=Intoshia linei TaxID=1819745 RepID=A0A177AT77_9BILA|nr:hypothetical protein A3Q56_07547 [Intoshia linei]
MVNTLNISTTSDISLKESNQKKHTQFEPECHECFLILNKKIYSKKSFNINSHLKAISHIAYSTEPIIEHNVGVLHRLPPAAGDMGDLDRDLKFQFENGKH